MEGQNKKLTKDSRIPLSRFLYLYLQDLIYMLLFYAAFHVTYASLLGGFWASFRWYFFIRFLESHWFVWSTQTNHLPMHIDTDKRKDWVSMQLIGTCDVEKSLFNDWFTGHLNYQIEHQ